MAGGITLTALAVLAAAFFSAWAYDAHRVRRLARMEQSFETFADLSQLLLRSHTLTERQVGAIEFMLSAFQDDRHGWLIVRSHAATQTSPDPVVTAELRATPDPILSGLGEAIESYYEYVAEVQPIAGFFIRRRLHASVAQVNGNDSQSKARAVSLFQAVFDRRHPTPA